MVQQRDERIDMEQTRLSEDWCCLSSFRNFVFLIVSTGDEPEDECEWKEYTTDAGRPYYFNSRTKQSEVQCSDPFRPTHFIHLIVQWVEPVAHRLWREKKERKEKPAEETQAQAQSEKTSTVTSAQSDVVVTSQVTSSSPAKKEENSDQSDELYDIFAEEKKLTPVSKTVSGPMGIS